MLLLLTIILSFLQRFCYFQVLFENFAEKTQNYMEFNHKTALNDAVLGMMVLSYLPQIDKQLTKVSDFLCNA